MIEGGPTTGRLDRRMDGRDGKTDRTGDRSLRAAHARGMRRLWSPRYNKYRIGSDRIGSEQSGGEEVDGGGRPGRGMKIAGERGSVLFSGEGSGGRTREGNVSAEESKDESMNESADNNARA